MVEGGVADSIFRMETSRSASCGQRDKRVKSRVRHVN
jgi:hypothetical protein